MSERHGLGNDERTGLQRIEVLTEVLAGRRTVASAGAVLAISGRQVNRLMLRCRDGGGGALIHGARGRTSNNHLKSGVREDALELVRRNYRDFGPTLATEALGERHGIKVGRETVRKWMVADGLWLSRKQRRTFHQPRLRRESYGELVQIYGSEHRWFENRGEPCTLLVFNRRRHEQAHAAAFRAQREHGFVLRSATWLS